MKSLFYRLIIFLDTASDTETNYAIAWYMAHNFQKVSTMGISKLAQECFVSTATISRFCRTLGYENFAHLKQECYTFSAKNKKYNNLIDMSFESMKAEPTNTTLEYCKKINNCVADLHNYLDYKIVDQVLKLIHESKTTAFFGTQFSHSAALHLQTDLLMLEKFTLAHIDFQRQIECAKSLDENSTAIIISINGYYLESNKKLLSYLSKSKCKVVLITCNPNIPIGIHVDQTIIMGDYRDRKLGKHLLLTTMELMSLRYYALYYPDVEQHIDYVNMT